MIENHTFKSVTVLDEDAPFAIHYMDGDVTNPIVPTNKDLSFIGHDPDTLDDPTRVFIVHCCNDIGAMGSGVARALFMRWPEVRSEYVDWFQSREGFELGNFQLVPTKTGCNGLVDEGFTVVNLIGQRSIRGKAGDVPVRYEAHREGFTALSDLLNEKFPYEGGVNPVIHMPRIGCNLAGGSWAKMEEIILHTFCERGYEVIVYDIPGGLFNP